MSSYEEYQININQQDSPDAREPAQGEPSGQASEATPQEPDVTVSPARKVQKGDTIPQVQA